MARLIGFGLVILTLILILIWTQDTMSVIHTGPRIDRTLGMTVDTSSGIDDDNGFVISLPQVELPQIGGGDVISEVRAMCSGSCDASRFVPLPESSANGAINPNGVKFLTDYATFATFNVPAGWAGQIWNGHEEVQFTGPVTLPQVAEGSFRKATTGR